MIKREIDFIYSLLVNVLFNSDTIELEDIFLYYGRNTRTIHFYKSIEVLNITIFKSGNVLTTIYLINDTVNPL